MEHRHASRPGDEGSRREGEDSEGQIAPVFSALNQALTALSAVSTDINAVVGGGALGSEDPLRNLGRDQLAEIADALRSLHLSLIEPSNHSLRCRLLLEAEDDSAPPSPEAPETGQEGTASS